MQAYKWQLWGENYARIMEAILWEAMTIYLWYNEYHIRVFPIGQAYYMNFQTSSLYAFTTYM